MRVVGRGGGSYFGFSFCLRSAFEMVGDEGEMAYLLVLRILIITAAWASKARLLVTLK